MCADATLLGKLRQESDGVSRGRRSLEAQCGLLCFRGLPSACPTFENVDPLQEVCRADVGHDIPSKINNLVQRIRTAKIETAGKINRIAKIDGFDCDGTAYLRGKVSLAGRRFAVADD